MKNYLLLILFSMPLFGFGQNVNIPDANFKAYLVGNAAINTNGDSEIQVSEANSFNGAIDCSNMNIIDLTGLDFFTSLTEFRSGGNQLVSIDLSNNIFIQTLDLSDLPFTNIDLSSLSSLKSLYIIDSEITTLELKNINLNNLFLPNNKITHLYIDNCTIPTITPTANWSYNMLFPNPYILIEITNTTFVNVVNNQFRDGIYIAGQATSTRLNLMNNVNLKNLDVSNNQITCLDISNCPDLEDLNCSNNLLEQLNTKNGNFNNMYVNALNNNLTCAEVDNIGQATNNWLFDSFTTLTTNCNYTNPCNLTTSIQVHTTNKELLRTIDVLGRETKGKKNEPLFYIYDDGTVEKRIVIE